MLFMFILTLKHAKMCITLPYFLFFYQENIYVVLLNEAGYSQWGRTGKDG